MKTDVSNRPSHYMVCVFITAALVAGTASADEIKKSGVTETKPLASPVKRGVSYCSDPREARGVIRVCGLGCPRGTSMVSYSPQESCNRINSVEATANTTVPSVVATERFNREQEVLSYLRNSGADPDEINRPWQVLIKTLAEKLGVADGKSVQMITTPQPADWGDASASVFRTSFYGDALPKWGATFDPQTASSFADVYGTFINSIVLKLPDQHAQKQADLAQEKWDTCNTSLVNETKLVPKHWADFNASNPPGPNHLNYQQYYSKFEAPHLQAIQNKCNSLAIVYQKWFNQATGGQGNLANAIMRYSQAKQVSALIPGTSDQYTMVWPYAFVQSVSDFVTKAEAQPTPDFIQSYDKQSGTYSATTSSWGASASYGWFFHASGGGSSSTVDTHSDEFGMDITIKGLTVFDMRPGDWFSQQLVQFFKDGPFQPGSVIERNYNAGTLYGEGGVFSLRSARFVVAYQPTIKLKMNSHDYHEAKSSWSASGGFGIGPFSFGGGASGSKTDISWNDTTNTLVAQDTSKVPQVIAVITDVLPDFK